MHSILWCNGFPQQGESYLKLAIFFSLISYISNMNLVTPQQIWRHKKFSNMEVHVSLYSLENFFHFYNEFQVTCNLLNTVLLTKNKSYNVSSSFLRYKHVWFKLIMMILLFDTCYHNIHLHVAGIRQNMIMIIIIIIIIIMIIMIIVMIIMIIIIISNNNNYYYYHVLVLLLLLLLLLLNYYYYSL